MKHKTRTGGPVQVRMLQKNRGGDIHRYIHTCTWYVSAVAKSMKKAGMMVRSRRLQVVSYFDISLTDET